MKKLPTCFFLALLLPALTLAAQVFGSLRYKGASVGTTAQVVVECPALKVPPQRVLTDRFGAYSVYVRGSGKCTLSVKYGSKQSKPYIIYSDQTDPVRYDFELIDEKGDLVLRRR
jgi:hypothetical protein